MLAEQARAVTDKIRKIHKHRNVIHREKVRAKAHVEVHTGPTHEDECPTPKDDFGKHTEVHTMVHTEVHTMVLYRTPKVDYTMSVILRFLKNVKFLLWAMLFTVLVAVLVTVCEDASCSEPPEAPMPTMEEPFLGPKHEPFVPPDEPPVPSDPSSETNATNGTSNKVVCHPKIVISNGSHYPVPVSDPLTVRCLYTPLLDTTACLSTYKPFVRCFPSGVWSTVQYPTEASTRPVPYFMELAVGVATMSLSHSVKKQVVATTFSPWVQHPRTSSSLNPLLICDWLILEYRQLLAYAEDIRMSWQYHREN